MYRTLIANPQTRVRHCQTVERGGAHGALPCNGRASVHCLRTGEDLCPRHESAHTARVRCGQGEHIEIPQG
jgi:hypothetical protein